MESFVGNYVIHRKINWSLLCLFCITMLLQAFDFKGAESSGFFQIFSFSATVFIVFFLVLLLFRLKPVLIKKNGVYVILFMFFYLLSTFFTAIINNVPINNYIVVISSHILFFLAILSCYLIFSRYGIDRLSGFFIKVLLFVTIASCIWTYYLGVNISGVTVETLRFRVVSPLYPLLVGYVIASYIEKKITVFFLVCLFLMFYLLLVSQTRGFLIIIIIPYLVVLYLNSKNFFKFCADLLKILFSVTAVLIVVLSLSKVFLSGVQSTSGSDFFELWIGRLSTDNENLSLDVTKATRLAEYSGQMDILLSDPIKMIIGAGYGSLYSYSGKHREDLIMAIGQESLGEIDDYWNGGHSLWVYSFYTGGFLFGGSFIIFLLVVIIRSLFIVRSALSLKSSVDRFFFLFVALTVLSFISTGFTGYTFGPRSTSYIFGIFVMWLFMLDKPRMG